MPQYTTQNANNLYAGDIQHFITDGFFFSVYLRVNNPGSLRLKAYVSNVILVNDVTCCGLTFGFKGL